MTSQQIAKQLLTLAAPRGKFARIQATSAREFAERLRAELAAFPPEDQAHLRALADWYNLHAPELDKKATATIAAHERDGNMETLVPTSAANHKALAHELMALDPKTDKERTSAGMIAARLVLDQAWRRNTMRNAALKVDALKQQVRELKHQHKAERSETTALELATKNNELSKLSLKLASTVERLTRDGETVDHAMLSFLGVYGVTLKGMEVTSRARRFFASLENPPVTPKYHDTWRAVVAIDGIRIALGKTELKPGKMLLVLRHTPADFDVPSLYRILSRLPDNPLKQDFSRPGGLPVPTRDRIAEWRGGRRATKQAARTYQQARGRIACEARKLARRAVTNSPGPSLS